MLCHDLKQSFHARKPSNVAELKLLYKGATNAVPIRKRHQMHPPFRKQMIHQMDTSQPILSQNSQRAGGDGAFIQTK